MNKYFNKGLIYQWFNSAKMMILLGIVVWGVFCNIFVEAHIYGVSQEISNDFFNGYSTYTIFSYAILGVIFAMIHFMSQGINRRNNNMFLTSAPYTKKQIKYNELICLLINIVIFMAVYMYINIMAYVRHYDLISIIDGYFTVLGIEILKIILFGIIGVFILLIVDSMFSNTIVGIICMISVLPGSLIFIAMRILTILQYIPGRNGGSFLRRIGDIINFKFFGLESIYLIDDVNIRFIENDKLISEFILVFLIAVVLSIVYLLIQKKFKVESNTRMFTSKLNEKIIVLITSIGAGSFALTVISEVFDYNNYNYEVLNGMNLIKALTFDIGIITLVAFIVYRLINKLLSNIQ